MTSFIDTLNESAVTYVVDLSQWGWSMEGDGYEAISPSGEIRAFKTYKEANDWRMSEVREFANL